MYLLTKLELYSLMPWNHNVLRSGEDFDLLEISVPLYYFAYVSSKYIPIQSYTFILRINTFAPSKGTCILFATYA